MCNSCQVLYINGIECHETGCPEAMMFTMSKDKRGENTMKVQVDEMDMTRRCRIYSGFENWDLCGTPAEVYQVALKEYGRCASKIYCEPNDKHIGWVFQKRVKYTDSDKGKTWYLQETWICPVAKHEIKNIVEYAL